MIPKAETDPFYLPVINLSGETVPPFGLMKIIGLDANATTIQISKPDRDNDNSGLLANSDFPLGDNKTGQGRMVMPFVVDTNGEGSPPSRDEIWGTENGSWFLSRDRIGFKVLAVAANSTRVLVEKMQTQYIASLRVTNATMATSPGLTGYYPVVERYLDSVNQTYSEGPTGYLKLDSAPTVNQTYFGYRDGCNLLPTYRPVNGTVSSSSEMWGNVTQSANVSGLTTYGFTQVDPTAAPNVFEPTSGGITGYPWGNPAKEENSNPSVAVGTIIHLALGDSVTASSNVTKTQIGNGSVPTIQEVYLKDAGGGNFSLTYNDNSTLHTTGNINWPATASAVETALEALTPIVNVTVSGNGWIGSPYNITFNDSNNNIPLLLVQTANLSNSQEYYFKHQNVTASGGSNITGNMERFRLISKTNNTTWNGTLLNPQANGTTTNGTLCDIFVPNTSIGGTALIDCFEIGQEIAVQTTTVSNTTVRFAQWIDAPRFAGNRHFLGDVGIGNATATSYNQAYGYVQGLDGNNGTGQINLIARSFNASLRGDCFLSLSLPVYPGNEQAVCFVGQNASNVSGGNGAFGVVSNGSYYIGVTDTGANSSGMVSNVGPNGTLWVFYNIFRGGLLAGQGLDQQLTTDLIWYPPGNQTLTEFLATL